MADIRTAVDGTQTSRNIVKRIALVAQSWEGLEVLDIGVVIGGDELRPSEDYDGGAVFRFVPDTFHECDGCVRMLSVRDPEAEPSGFIFDGTGTVAFYHLQHGQQFDGLLDFDSNPMNGHTDDLIKLTGFEAQKRHVRHLADD